MDAHVNDAASRPKKADGTADWETIFEDPESGLVPLVSKAQSKDGLKACASVVINQLFTRKNDASERERLNALLAKLMAKAEASGGLEEARDGVIGMLRAIKQERLLKAAAYIAEKKAKGETAPERRRAGGAFKGDVHHLFGGGQTILIAAGGLAIVAAALIAGALWIGNGGPKEQAAGEPAAEQAVEKAAPEPEAEPEPKPEPKAETKPAPKEPEKAVAPKQPEKPAYPKTIYFKPMYWVIKTTNMRRGYIYYQPTLTVSNKDAYSKICTRLPSVRDAFNIALSQKLPADGKADARDLAAAAAWAARQLNDKFGSGTVIDVQFLRDGSPTFRVRAVPCR